jgi:hypothetical protein
MVLVLRLRLLLLVIAAPVVLEVLVPAVEGQGMLGTCVLTSVSNGWGVAFQRPPRSIAARQSINLWLDQKRPFLLRRSLLFVPVRRYCASGTT